MPKSPDPREIDRVTNTQEFKDMSIEARLSGVEESQTKIFNMLAEIECKLEGNDIPKKGVPLKTWYIIFRNMHVTKFASMIYITNDRNVWLNKKLWLEMVFEVQATDKEDAYIKFLKKCYDYGDGAVAKVSYVNEKQYPSNDDEDDDTDE